ncbi:MAG TPA: MBOAT family protein [Verrucomicrobiae bacterium]|nr:MBOAT family protein [Verrucomicrobiae bacterium]
MLFNSYTFIFGFLPVTLLVFVVLVKRMPRRIAIAWLVAASLFYYGWERPENLLLLSILLVGNYLAGVYLCRHQGAARGRVVLVLGLAANLGALAYYKYANFIIQIGNDVLGAHWPPASVILPLGISFFIFQKIAYLVDAYRGQTRGYHFIDYCLFVTFFPQLIAGPIVHHSEVVPQFERRTGQAFSAQDLSVGLTQFVCGLFKKVALADRMALYATPVFTAAAAGGHPTFLEAWIGALAYAFQLYFDFSGYSDMALGLGRMFGIRLPANFDSPYKAVNIVDFWRRWHMTLSRFLRDYLYIPLGGNRRGPTWRYVNLMITMVLGGLWHGAGWTFLFWGALHGLYLVLNHAWMSLRAARRQLTDNPSAVGVWAGRTVTFLAVGLAWVFFRAANFATAGRMLSSMAGGNGFGFTSSFHAGPALTLIIILWAGVWVLPNTQEILAMFEPALPPHGGSKFAHGDPVAIPWLTRWQWRPTTLWAAVVAVITVFTLTQMSRISEFIYWQF